MNEATSFPGGANRLADETSPYLRMASHQPVHWYPWGEEAFSAARAEHKPILLDIGAVWCHWCHVMDLESYENDATARIINDNYVPVKVDRDARPDVDSRYQSAVSAMSGQGGWPLTVFLTPDGEAFFGGTYFPPEDRFGRIGFPKLLNILAEAFRREPEKVLQQAEQVRSALRNGLSEMGNTGGFSDSMVDGVVSSILAQVDTNHGGFGSAPKFPHCSTIELLLCRYDRSKDSRILDAVTLTLRQMARGGVYDQLGGGFHRYSTDNEWIVPHFEKMLYDNAALLTNYLHTYQATNDNFFREIAGGILNFSDAVLSDRVQGGFFASQDADVAPGDDGSYFTWTLDEVKQVLNEDEFRVLQLHFGISSTGPMHTDRLQNVLRVERDFDDIASTLDKPISSVIATVTAAKRKMLVSRLKRKTPFVDTSVYAHWNGMMISAYLEAFKVLGDDDTLQFALKTLERILREHSKDDDTISHRAVSIGSEGFLDDQVEIANALLQAFEVTSEQRYLEKADSIMHRAIEHFGDRERGGFFDIPVNHDGAGLLSVPTKPIQDSPVAAANAVAISVLNRISVLTNRTEYRAFAEQSLQYCAGKVGAIGMFASQFFLSLDEFLHPRPHIAIISEPKDKRGNDLMSAALRTYRPGKIVALYSPSAFRTLPEVLQSTVGSYAGPVAYVCSQFSCAPPSYDPNTLISTIRTFGRN